MKSMRSMLLGLGFGLGLMSLTASQVSAATLKVGDKAPKLTIEKWVKGAPVTKLEPGKVYVVEFWATWCPPCRASIPHLTEIQKRFKDKKVTVIGVSSEDGGLDKITPFVENDMGEKMDYTVAFDAEGQTSKAWMEAAGQNGIPAAFVVEQTGRIAWIGHPMAGLDGVLEQVVAGEYDIEAAIKEAARAAALEEKARPIQEKLQAAAAEGNTEEILSCIDQLVEIDGEMFGQMAFFKFQVLVRENEDYAGAYAYLKEISGTKIAKNVQVLNGFAWSIMDAEWITERDMPLALELAKKADAASGGKDSSVLDTLARAYFETGDKAKALEVQKKAVDLAPEGDMKVELQKRLDGYAAE